MSIWIDGNTCTWISFSKFVSTPGNIIRWYHADSRKLLPNYLLHSRRSWPRLCTSLFWLSTRTRRTRAPGASRVIWPPIGFHLSIHHVAPLDYLQEMPVYLQVFDFFPLHASSLSQSSHALNISVSRWKLYCSWYTQIVGRRQVYMYLYSEWKRATILSYE